MSMGPCLCLPIDKIMKNYIWEFHNLIGIYFASALESHSSLSSKSIKVVAHVHTQIKAFVVHLFETTRKLSIIKHSV